MKYLKYFENKYSDFLTYPVYSTFKQTHTSEDLTPIEINRISSLIPPYLLINAIGYGYYKEGWEGNPKINILDDEIFITDPFTLIIEKFEDEWFCLSFGENNDGDKQRSYKCDTIDGLIECMEFVFKNSYLNIK